MLSSGRYRAVAFHFIAIGLDLEPRPARRPGESAPPPRPKRRGSSGPPRPPTLPPIRPAHEREVSSDTLLVCAPRKIRTSDNWFRRPVLYPAELWALESRANIHLPEAESTRTRAVTVVSPGPCRSIPKPRGAPGAQKGSAGFEAATRVSSRRPGDVPLRREKRHQCAQTADPERLAYWMLSVGVERGARRSVSFAWLQATPGLRRVCSGRGSFPSSSACSTASCFSCRVALACFLTQASLHPLRLSSLLVSCRLFADLTRALPDRASCAFKLGFAPNEGPLTGGPTPSRRTGRGEGRRISPTGPGMG